MEEVRFSSARGRKYEGFEEEKEGKWQQPFHFVQMADCQLGMFDAHVSWDKEVSLCEKAVEHINRLSPRFVIICGDLTHSSPGQNEYYEGQVADFKKVMRKIKPSIPLVCVCGNHDIGDIPNAVTVKEYNKNYGDDYFSFWVGGCMCLVLNSTLFCHDEDLTAYQQQQIAWLQEQLAHFKEAKEKNPEKVAHLMVFQHHPIFTETPDEKEISWYALSPINLPMRTRTPLVNMLSDAGCSAVFAGHWHRNSVASHGKMQMVTTCSLGMPLYKIRVDSA